MMRRAVFAARPLVRSTTLRPQLNQIRLASASLSGESPEVRLSPSPEAQGVPVEDADPLMNGNYPNPARLKRSLRDPYDDWWDPQERRNYNEAVHEDNDILGVFSTEPYTHFTTRWGWVLMGSFVASVLGLCTVVGITYPDKPSVPRRFPDGLEKELGGNGALLALKEGEES